MPRRSFAALSMPPALVPVPSRRLDPPATLPDVQKQIWADVIVGMPPDHFRPNDGLLLRHLCAATAKADELALALETETDPARLELLLGAHARAVTSMVNTGVKLRLWTARNRAPSKLPEPSPLERARMQGII